MHHPSLSRYILQYCLRSSLSPAYAKPHNEVWDIFDITPFLCYFTLIRAVCILHHHKKNLLPVHCEKGSRRYTRHPGSLSTFCMYFLGFNIFTLILQLFKRGFQNVKPCFKSIIGTHPGFLPHLECVLWYSLPLPSSGHLPCHTNIL